jgi:hypothetical protein
LNDFGDMQEHGVCERCGDAHHTNSPSTLGFGFPAFVCNPCVREFMLYGQTSKEILEWEKARATEAAYKLAMKNPEPWTRDRPDQLDLLFEKYRDSHIATERAMAAVNVMAARFLANKLP